MHTFFIKQTNSFSKQWHHVVVTLLPFFTIRLYFLLFLILLILVNVNHGLFSIDV